MSFLDVVACGFGAIILLFVLSKQAEPVVLEGIREDLSGVILELEQTIFDIRGEAVVLNRELDAKEEQLSREKTRLARLRGELSSVRGEFESSKDTLQAKGIIEGELASARQELTAEMRRLLGQSYRRPESDATIMPWPS